MHTVPETGTPRKITSLRRKFWERVAVWTAFTTFKNWRRKHQYRLMVLGFPDGQTDGQLHSVGKRNLRKQREKLRVIFGETKKKRILTPRDRGAQLPRFERVFFIGRSRTYSSRRTRKKAGWNIPHKSMRFQLFICFPNLKCICLSIAELNHTLHDGYWLDFDEPGAAWTRKIRIKCSRRFHVKSSRVCRGRSIWVGVAWGRLGQI